MKDSPLNNDGRALLSFLALAIAALAYFTIPQVLDGWPPAYMRIGPVEFGQIVETTCHGVRVAGEMVVEACK